MTVFIAGQQVPVPGLTTTCQFEDPARLTINPRCYRSRVTSTGEVVLGLVCHTIHGNKPKAGVNPIVPGAGPAGREYTVIKNWNRGAARTPPRPASAHFVVGYDGAIVNPLDLATIAAYHVGTKPAGSHKLADRVNGWTVGLEMCQLADGRVYQATIDATATLFDWLAMSFGIPTVYPGDAATGAWLARELPRQTCLAHRGLCGHFNFHDSNRGPGDPGAPIFAAMHTKGWTPWQ